MTTTPALYAAGSPIHFTRPRRRVHTTWLHCSASDRAAHDDVAVMRRWHLARGFADVGYHFFIQKNGNIQAGRPLERTPSAQRGHNDGAIAICLHGLEEAKFTNKQFASVQALCSAILQAYAGRMRYRGHCEVSSKTCPVFDYRQVLGLDADGHMTHAPQAPAPRPSSPVAHERAIQLTDRGPAVSVLQNLLEINGVPCRADGLFGQQTRTAVMLFQSQARLEATGKADSRTRRLLAQGLRGVRTLSSGDEGEDVKAFQRILQLHGITAEADGVFGAETQQALRAYRKMHGLPTSDHVDALAREAAWSYQQAGESTLVATG